MKDKRGPLSITSKLLHSYRTRQILKLLLIEAAAFALSVIVVVTLMFIVGVIGGEYYEMRHPIPAAERGEDLGVGLIVVFAAIGSLLISIPCAILLHIFLFKKFFFIKENKG